MEVLQRTANRGSISTGFDIANSVVFETANSERLSRTNTNTGQRRTFSISAWIKRTKLGYNRTIGVGVSGNDQQIIIFNASDQLEWYDYHGGAYSFNYKTNRVFRDTSAWYHFLFAVDTEQGTESNRVRLYINGVEETSFATQTEPSQNRDTNWNYANGSKEFGNILNEAPFASCYMSEVAFVDDAQLAPTDVGEFDEDTGIWKPIDISGLTFGTSGSYCEFKNASALGEDSSSNGNDFTAANITSADQAQDTPTNNFCTLMPPQASITGTATVVSNGGTTMISGTTAQQNAFGSMGVRSGKWYFESNVSNLGGAASYNHFFGVIAADRITALNNGGGYYIGEIANTWGFTSNNRGTTGGTENPNFPSETATSGTTEVMGIALDMDNGKIWVHKAGTYATNNSSVTGNPATGAAPQYDNLLTSTDEHILVGGGVYTSNNSVQRNMNFGNPMNANFTNVGTHSDANGYGSFAYAPPTGYYALCTKNLAEYG